MGGADSITQFVSLFLSDCELLKKVHTNIHTHTYVYVCVCLCVCTLVSECEA